MPKLWNYRILISHSWKYQNDYETVKKWLNEANYFKWSNHSVCCDNPLDTKRDYELQSELTGQISGCTCIIVISGMYGAYSKWIDYEISEAVRMKKPIIAIRPRGQERIPSIITNNATVLVNWNSTSLIQAIRNHTN